MSIREGKVDIKQNRKQKPRGEWPPLPPIHEGGECDMVLPKRGLIKTLNGQDNRNITIKVMHQPFDAKKITQAIKEAFNRASILETPPPWTRSWLKANGLEAIYQHGKALLQFKK